MEESSVEQKKWYDYDLNPCSFILRKRHARQLAELDERLKRLGPISRRTEISPREESVREPTESEPILSVKQMVEDNGEKRWYEYDLNPVNYLLQGYHRKQLENLDARLAKLRPIRRPAQQ